MVSFAKHFWTAETKRHREKGAQKVIDFHSSGDETHTGSISVQNLTPPLKQRWVVNFGQPISYPLIADGKVFVTVKNAATQGSVLFALDAANGMIMIPGISQDQEWFAGPVTVTLIKQSKGLAFTPALLEKSVCGQVCINN